MAEPRTLTTISGDVRVIISPLGIAELERSKDGPVIRDLFVRGERVKTRAKIEAPRKTGNLEQHIVKRLVEGPHGPEMLVGVEGVAYAIFVHEGTEPHPIDPVNGPFLVFVGRDGTLVFARHVDHPGNKPNRFLVRALRAGGG